MVWLCGWPPKPSPPHMHFPTGLIDCQVAFLPLFSITFMFSLSDMAEQVHVLDPPRPIVTLLKLHCIMEKEGKLDLYTYPTKSEPYSLKSLMSHSRH